MENGWLIGTARGWLLETVGSERIRYKMDGTAEEMGRCGAKVEGRVVKQAVAVRCFIGGWRGIDGYMLKWVVG